MDLYVVLGVERGATPGDIKRAYKRLARKYHPDINPGDRMAAAQFRRIAEAYETLSDPDRRRRYDTTGLTSQGEARRAYGFEGFDFSVSVHGTDASTFGDLFADVFQQRDAHRVAERDGPARPRRRRAHSRAGQGTRRQGRRRDRRPVHHAARPAASAVPPRGRRRAHHRAGRDSRSGARREDRSAVARRL